MSIIVCVHNDLENIKSLLNSLLNQNHPHFEIVVVNDRSDQDTYNYLYFLKKNQPGIKVVTIDQNPDKFSPKKYALFLGIKAATYEHLLLTDSDCMPAGNEWITGMQSCYTEKKQIILGYSPVKKYPGFLNNFICYETLITALQYLGFAKAGMPYMGVGRNLSYIKMLFFKGHGFVNHIHILGGDDDLFINENGNAKNTVIQIMPETHVFTEPKHAFPEWIIQKKRHLSVGFYYRFANKIKAALYPVTNAATLITAIVLFSMQFKPEWVQYILIGRYAGITLIAGLLIHRLKDNTRWFLVPLFDIIYVFYILTIGLIVLKSRKLKWK